MIWMNILGVIVLAISAIANLAAGVYYYATFNLWVGIINLIVMGLLMYETRRLMYVLALQKAQAEMEAASKELEELNKKASKI